MGTDGHSQQNTELCYRISHGSKQRNRNVPGSVGEGTRKNNRLKTRHERHVSESRLTAVAGRWANTGSTLRTSPGCADARQPSQEGRRQHTASCPDSSGSCEIRLLVLPGGRRTLAHRTSVVPRYDKREWREPTGRRSLLMTEGKPVPKAMLVERNGSPTT